MFNKLHWLGYTESYSETQNYKYCFLNGKSGDGTSDTSDMLGTIVKETYVQIDDVVAVDAAHEDLSVIITTSL